MEQLQSIDLKDILNKKRPFIKEKGNWIFNEKDLCLENHKYSHGYIVHIMDMSNYRGLLKWILHLNSKSNEEMDVIGFIDLLEEISYNYFNTNLFPLFAVGNKTINWKTKTKGEQNESKKR